MGRRIPSVLAGLQLVALLVAAPLRADDTRPTAGPFVIVRRDVHEQVRWVPFALNRKVPPPSSLSILDDVAKVLRENPDLSRLRLEGHADPAEQKPLLLSRQRAEWVQQALIDRGIAAERLEAAGYGVERPRVPVTDPHRELNRRVEFTIIER